MGFHSNTLLKASAKHKDNLKIVNVTEAQCEALINKIITINSLEILYLVLDHPLELILHIRDNEKVNRTIKPAEQMQDRVRVEAISALNLRWIYPF